MKYFENSTTKKKSKLFQNLKKISLNIFKKFKIQKFQKVKKNPIFYKNFVLKKYSRHMQSLEKALNSIAFLKRHNALIAT